MYDAETEERFWSKVSRHPMDCWEWTGGIFIGNGYGRFKSGGKDLRSNRVAWELANQCVIPNGLSICHRCDNRKCVRPSHLFTGTTADNIHDRGAKNRTARGEKSGKAKLTDQDIIAIRMSTESNRALGRRYGVAQSNIRFIKRRILWSHI
jgi:hypothetical protein